MSKPRLQLKIENFGPIVEGTVEFKPLTFLIGPNNSGKSYVATLLYALSRVFDSGLDPYELLSPAVTRDLTQFLVAKSREGVESLAISELPQSLRELASERLTAQARDAESRIEAALKQYLSVARLAQLVQHDDGKSRALRISSGRSSDEELLANILVTRFRTNIEVVARPLDLIDLSTERRFVDAWRDSAFATLALGIHPWFSLVNDFGYDSRHVYYLPAARSGILASWPLLASLAVRSVSRTLGRQQADIAPLPGVVGDFLEDVIERFSPVGGANGRDHDRAALQSVLEVVEGQLLRGRVIIEERQPFAAELIYESEGMRLPLQRTSSMVGELAPVDLWVRELLEADDLLIIDEPESHLHPENQRLIARALVRLVNAGVSVVAPTHSSTILHQVSNLLLASEMSTAARGKAGLTDSDRIQYEDVAVYLFDRREDGVYIVPVEIEPGFGIAEDEFVRVAEAMGDETFRFSFAAANMPA